MYICYVLIVSMAVALPGVLGCMFFSSCSFFLAMMVIGKCTSKLLPYMFFPSSTILFVFAQSVYTIFPPFFLLVTSTPFSLDEHKDFSELIYLMLIMSFYTFSAICLYYHGDSILIVIFLSFIWPSFII